jgi:hypothetical protein
MSWRARGYFRDRCGFESGLIHHFQRRRVLARQNVFGLGALACHRTDTISNLLPLRDSRVVILQALTSACTATERGALMPLGAHAKPSCYPGSDRLGPAGSIGNLLPAPDREEKTGSF